MALDIKIKKHLPSFDLDIEFTAENEAVGFLGASGCGKSLTLRCVAGVETPDEGHIIVNGKTFFDSEKKINLTPQQRKTALLFQNYQLFPNMSVAQNVAAGMPKGLAKDEVARRVKRYLGMFDLDGFQDRYPLRLSGGQQQRVLLARALCATRKMLLLDEPVSGLDPKATAQMYALIESLNRQDGITVIMVSHDIAAALRYATHILHIGRTTFFGTTAQYLQSPQGRLFAAQNGGDVS